MALTPGTKFGPYEIIGPLGAGGMGEVYRARDGRLQRNVAIKLLPPMLAADPSLKARFEQEARALAALNHPNIVAIYDVGEDEGRAYMVSELVEGQSLRAVLDLGAMPVRKANDAAIQMADGMAAAHALGIVHRDLKPENVMVTPAGVVKVLDFGLAKQGGSASSGNGADNKTATMALSQPGTVMGTAGYMSPEQVRAEPVDARSDIFSFGCVLYEMLTGQRAFANAGSMVETMHAVLSSEPPELANAESGKLPPAHAVIVRRCLEKRPEQRFQSAADLAFALRGMSGVASTAVHQPPPPKKKIPIWPIAAGVGALALLAAGYFARGLFAKSEPEHFQRITFREGSVNNARFTADGKNVVYSARWEDAGSHVFLAVPGNPESRDLGLENGTRLLAVSSKDDLALLTSNGTLERTSLSGGQMRPLLDGVLDADWSPDGASIAVLRWTDGRGRIEYPIGTALIEKVPWALPSIRVSPDGERVAFLRRGNGRSTALNVVDRTGKVQLSTQIGGQTDSNQYSRLSWNAKGDEIWFRSMDQGDTQTIYAVNMKGVKRVVANLPGKIEFFDRSKDGSSVLLGNGSEQFGIMGVGPGETAEKDLSCLDHGSLVSISDEGRMILASVSGDSGGPKGAMYVRKTDGSPAVRLGEGSAIRMSPDGKWVSGYVLQENGTRKFGTFPTGAGEMIPLDMPDLGLGFVSGWIDGNTKTLVTGALKGHPWRCFVYDSAKKTAQPVCPDEVPQTMLFLLSPDKKYVLSDAPGGKGRVAYALDGGAAIEVKGIEEGEFPAGWTADSKSLYVGPRWINAATAPVFTVEIATGKRTRWKELRMSHPQDDEGFNLKITPDGKAYAYNFSEVRSELYLAKGLR